MIDYWLIMSKSIWSYFSNSIIAWLGHARIDNVSYEYKNTSPTTDYKFRVLNAVGHQISIAFGVHAVALEIQATISSTPEIRTSKIHMWKRCSWSLFDKWYMLFPCSRDRIMVERVNFPPGIALRLVTRSAYIGEDCLFNPNKLNFISMNH